MYALGVGHGMINYTSKVRIPSHLCDPGQEFDRLAWGKGTSIDMAIQVVAYHAIAMLRESLITLSEPLFQHFQKRTKMNGVFKFSMQIEPSTLYEKRMTELVMCEVHMIRCMEVELWTTHARFVSLQRRVEPYVRMTTVPSTILYYPQGDDATVYEVIEYPHRYLEAQGVRIPQCLM